MVPVFSIFFFALLITFGISQPVESGTQEHAVFVDDGSFRNHVSLRLEYYI